MLRMRRADDLPFTVIHQHKQAKIMSNPIIIEESDFKLSPQDRAAYKRALIQAGATTAGLSDAHLLARYNAMMGVPMHAEANKRGRPPKARPEVTPEVKPMPEALPDAAAQLMALAKKLADEAKAAKPAAPAVTEARIIALIEEHAPRIFREALASLIKGV